MDEPAWTVVAAAATRDAIDEQAFVLRAIGVPHRIEFQRDPSGARDVVVLAVPGPFAEAAARELQEYRREIQDRPPRDEIPPMPPGAWASALLFATALIALHVLSTDGAFGLDWWGTGVSDARRILDGEWWRSATALTLHSDVPHVASNVVFGVAYGVLLAQLVGSGAAWSASFAAGVVGNLANAWFHAGYQGVEHRSVGASTMVFGALGCLVAYEWRRRTRLRMRLPRRLAPPLLGLVMLGMYGTGGERTDVGAHVFGWAAGAVIGAGIGAALAARRGARPWSPGVQIAAGLGACAVLAAAWTLALAG